MSTKAAAQQPRRAPLSLSGGGKHQNQSSGKSSDSNGNSNNNASAKNDKLSGSQKLEPTINEAKESTPKDVKKAQNTEKKHSQQPTGNNETTKRNEKVEEKKVQNGAGKAPTNGAAKEKQQNGSDKPENGNGNTSNAKSGTTNSNGNATAKSTPKAIEKSTAPVVKEDISKVKEQKPAQSYEKNEKESEREKEKEKKKDNVQEKIVEKETRSRRHETTAAEAEKKQSDKTDSTKIDDTKTVQEKIVEKETRSRRHETSAAEAEKKQSDKTESTKSDSTKTEVAASPTSRSSSAQSKLSTTPTRGVDKSSGANTPTKAVEKSSASQRSKTVTTVIDDDEMQPPVLESSPVKPQKNFVAPAAVAIIQPPAATSTPGKALSVTQKTKLQAAAARSEIQRTGSSPDRSSAPRTFTQIAGRRSIRPLNEYTPSKFQSNLQFRESYRRINTELDVSSTTNSSMNVTVGSEVPNNSSFSFFGRGRKRERTPPPQSQSTMELHTDADYSPPKRARMDMFSFFSVVSSPITMLRSRFSRASIQSSTPMRLASKLAANDEAEVQNVSGISIEEEMIEGAESDEKTATEDVTVGKKTDDDATSKMDSPMKVDEKCGLDLVDEKNFEEEVELRATEVHEIAAGIADTSVTSVKNKRCNIM